MRRILNSEAFLKVAAALIALAIFAALFGIAWAIRAHAPCSIFPLAEAPTRCLPGAVR